MPKLYEIRLMVECDDEAEVERLADQVSKVACPQDDPSPGHVCPVPWFIVTSEVDDPEAWRDLLNR